VDALNEKEFNGRKIYVGRAQKKLERVAELKRKHDMLKAERMNRYQVFICIFISHPLKFR